jgi:hypothetical protein
MKDEETYALIGLVIGSFIGGVLISILPVLGLKFLSFIVAPVAMLGGMFGGDLYYYIKIKK